MTKAMLNLTQEAANKILEIAKQQKKEKFGLKIFAFPGGCAGVQYGLDFEDKPHDTDTVIKQHGVELFIDKDSGDLLKGAKIDYVSNGEQSGFKIDNPNIKHECGCGSDFC